MGSAQVNDLGQWKINLQYIRVKNSLAHNI